MSPTQTELPSPGASASTSTGSGDQRDVPTVRPEPSTVNTRPSSPESLVVTSRPSTTARPLDSTISGSRKVSSTATSSADTNSSGISRAPTSSRTGGVQQHSEPRGDAPGGHELVVLLAHSPTG